MGRTKKTTVVETLLTKEQNTKDLQEIFPPMSVQIPEIVISNDPEIIIDNEPIEPENEVFKKGNVNSVNLHKVKFNGADRWWTENQIKIAMQSQPDHLVLPENSLYNQDTKNIACKTCGNK
jgi:hypothetical protein